MLFDCLSKRIIEICEGLNADYTVTPKTHQLLHYSKLVEKWGPLILWSTLKFERKHLEFKVYSETSNCRINMTKQFARHHQFRCAMQFIEKRFATINFFPNEDLESANLIEIPASTLSQDYYRLNATHPEIPRKSGKNVLFNILQRGYSSKLWLLPKFWYKGKDGDLVATGYIYQESIKQTMDKTNFKLLGHRYLPNVKYVRTVHICFQVNFLYTRIEVHKNVAITRHYLIRGNI